jgi:hypothetical protein
MYRIRIRFRRNRNNLRTTPPSEIIDFAQLPAGNPRRGSDSPPDCHSLPRRRFAYPLHRGGFRGAVRTRRTRGAFGCEPGKTGFDGFRRTRKISCGIIRTHVRKRTARAWVVRIRIGFGEYATFYRTGGRSMIAPTRGPGDFSTKITGTGERRDFYGGAADVCQVHH